MEPKNDLRELKGLARSKTQNKGDQLKKALMILAIPTTAILCTACYGAPMPEPLSPTTAEGVDCDGDGAPDAADVSECDNHKTTSNAQVL